jgi:hypothetical protein
MVLGDVPCVRISSILLTRLEQCLGTTGKVWFRLALFHFGHMWRATLSLDCCNSRDLQGYWVGWVVLCLERRLISHALVSQGRCRRLCGMLAGCVVADIGSFGSVGADELS